MGNQGKTAKKQWQKIRFSSYFRSEFNFREDTLTADRLAQLVEHRTAVRRGRRFKSRPDQHSGSLNN